MKTNKTIIIAVLATIILAPFSNANLLAARAKLETAKSQAEAAASAKPDSEALAKAAADKAKAFADFNTGASGKFGADWIERWQNSKYANPDDEAGDIYLSGKVFNPTTPAAIRLSVAKQREVLAYIATKPQLVHEDLMFVQLASVYNPEVANRLEEFAALLSSKGIRGEDYFILKHITLLKKSAGLGSQAFTRHMTIAEWFELASSQAHFSPETFNAMRNAIIGTTARILIDKRRATGLSVEGPEFNAAFAPVLDALNAPKFAGLAEAVRAIDIGITIPTPDFTAQEAIANAVADAASRNTIFYTPWEAPTSFQKGLGSVMFVKGADAYREWREALLQPR